MKALRKVLNSGKTEPPAAIEPESPEAHLRLRNPYSTDLGSRERTIYRNAAVLTFFFSIITGGWGCPRTTTHYPHTTQSLGVEE